MSAGSPKQFRCRVWVYVSVNDVFEFRDSGERDVDLDLGIAIPGKDIFTEAEIESGLMIHIVAVYLQGHGILEFGRYGNPIFTAATDLQVRERLT